MELTELELEILKIIREEKEAYGAATEVAGRLTITPDYSEGICEALAGKGYLEAIGGRKKYRLSKEGEKALK